MPNDVYEFITNSATIIVEDTEVIQAEVITEYKNAFGQDLIVTPDTPQGVLITAETLARKAVADNNAVVANQINPNLAGGTFLDAILALTGATRTVEQFTVVSGNLTGIPGTIIPEGSIARETVNQNQFATTSTITLALDGTGTVNFKAVTPGPITIGIGTLTQIVSQVLGWETVTNPAVQTIIGASTQSDAAARLFRNNTLALQGQSISEAIISGLFAIPDVTSVTFRENISPSTQVIDGVTMIGHSIYACVDGGTDQEIAQVLVNKKSAGAAYNNGASSDPEDVTITDPYSHQIMHVLFDRPNLIPIAVNVIVSAGSIYTDPINVVKNAIIDYANGNVPNEPGLVIGAGVSTFELSGAINIEAPGIFVHDLQISLTSIIAFQYEEIPISVFEKATISASSISVTLV